MSEEVREAVRLLASLGFVIVGVTSGRITVELPPPRLG